MAADNNDNVNRWGGLGPDSSVSKSASSSLEDPLSGPKLQALRLVASYLMDRDEGLSEW